MEYIKESLGDNIVLEYPNVLYKYRSWNDINHRKILLENSVFLSSPSGFEDIKDCNVPESFPSDKDELYNAFYKKSKTENILYTRQQHRAFVRKWCIESPLADINKREILIEQFNNEFNNRFGVLSLTANPCNDEMWEKYGDNHKGICIGLDSSKLFSAVGGGGQVTYVENLPVIDFFNDDFETRHVKNILYKKSQWDFEQEYRLHKMWTYEVSIDDRNVQLPENCIIEVILGRYMDMSSKTEVINVIKLKLPSVKITHAK